MGKVTNFNEYLNRKEDEVTALNKIFDEKAVSKRAIDACTWNAPPANGRVQREINFLYETVGYIYVGDRKIYFDEVVKDVKIGEMNPEKDSIKAKAHLAFHSNGEWFYVVYEIHKKIDYDKKQLYRNSGFNIIIVDFTKLFRQENMKFYNSNGMLVDYFIELNKYFANVLMKSNEQIKLLSEMGSWE